MNEIEKLNIDAAKPLKNIRHERFARLYAGKCFGNASKAYRLAGYTIKPNIARSEGSRLLTNPNVMARIRHFRQETGNTLAIDATKIMEERLSILKGKDTTVSEKLNALAQIERSLGLDAPQKIAISSQTVLVIE